MSVPKPRPVLAPLAEVPVDPVVAAVPKADLHLHQEGKARVDRIVARRRGRQAFDWCAWARRVVAETPPGMGRLGAVYAPDDTLDLDGASDHEPELFVARVADTLEEGAADGAVLIEVRFGITLAESPLDFMPLFREAERRVRERYPRLRAEAIGFLHVVDDPAAIAEAERRLQACVAAARVGLGGVDFRVDPYDSEADPRLWAVAHRLAARAAEAGLGVTVHAGEFSTANLAAALRTPGLRRLGHAVYAADEPRLLEEIVRRGVTVECSLSCNVILGAAPSYEAHPIRRFVEAGVPVTLNTDLPVHACTTIGREYAIAAALGFTPADLLGFTRNAIRASFTSDKRRETLLADLGPNTVQ